ncbi:hypothetical protein KU393_24560, partial [Salmonella enterica subsp. enterica serovar Mbandaka]|nr:hypothetical protein [Salmonella enterica subsp. enterica serovar Mbandaka]
MVSFIDRYLVKPTVINIGVLSHYRQGHNHLFDYGSEIHEQLLDLLERYGPVLYTHLTLPM